MIFEWDEVKNRQNKAKHGLGFELAHKFEWENAVIRMDERQDYGELRLVAFGPIGGRLYSLVFVHRASDIRIISLRKSNKRERKLYEKDRQK